ncbi:hypothetical protein PAEPH01_0875 [Pancytospora epiphaga]|nr:hypothetical protein PAEPH01_0875 [Pancytospora epiphaga]
MRLLIVVPEKCQLDEYVQIPLLEDVHYSKLVNSEDILKKLTTSVIKLLKEINSKLPEDCVVKIDEIIADFDWNNLIEKGSTIKSILKDLESRFESIKENYTKRLETPFNDQINIPVNKLANSLSENEDDFKFIESSCVRVVKSKVKSFNKEIKKVLGAEYAIKLESTSKDVLYKIYYLKKETKWIKENIIEKYHFEQLKTINNLEQRKSPPTNINDVQNNKKNTAEAVKCAELYVDVCAFSGYVESLHRYGIPGRFKYMITTNKPSDQKRELKRATKVLLRLGFIEADSDDEDSLFTQVPLLEFKNE